MTRAVAVASASATFEDPQLERLPRARQRLDAQTLDALGASGFLRKQFLLALGRNVGFAGRALLTRTG